jgi:hypothetical protein
MSMMNGREQLLCEECYAQETKDNTARVAMIGPCSICESHHVGLIPLLRENFFFYNS